MSRLAEKWKTGRVLRLNTASDVNQKYADGVRVTDTPTFILFDPAGREVRRWVGETPGLGELP